MTDDREYVAELFRLQAEYCEKLGSPLYEGLLTRAADDIQAGGVTWGVLEAHQQDAPNTMLHLRLLGAAHRLVLAGEATSLARFYPSAGGRPDGDGAWSAFRELLGEQPDRIREELLAPVQTNEVGRCMGLIGAFLEVARRTALPLRVLEVGASAGLNLRFDRYFYSDSGLGSSFGPAHSTVRFADFVEEGRPPLDVETRVVERAGCDANPLQPQHAGDRLLLKSFVWPDQAQRFEALSAALDLARSEPLAVERADAGAWAERQLADPRPGVATVLFHSLVMMYLGDETRERLTGALERAGRMATDDAPFAWLGMELGGDEADVHLTIWPGGEKRLVAKAGYHGRPVRWLGG